MLKKLLVAILCLSLMFAFTACGSDDDTADSGESVNSTKTVDDEDNVDDEDEQDDQDELDDEDDARDDDKHDKDDDDKYDKDDADDISKVAEKKPAKKPAKKVKSNTEEKKPANKTKTVDKYKIATGYVGKSLSSLSAKIGRPLSFSESDSCEVEGAKEGVANYKGFKVLVQTKPNESTYYIQKVYK